MPKIARDSLLSIGAHLAPRLASVALFILIGRTTGADAAGTFALALSFALIATTIMRGLDELVVREVARQPLAAGRFLLNFTVVRLVFGFGLFACVAIAVLGILRYPPGTAQAILLLALSVLPDGVVYVAQAVLNAQRHFGGPAIVLGLTNGLKVAGGAAALALGLGLPALCWAWLVGSCLGALVLLAVALRAVGGLHRDDWRDWSAFSSNLQSAASLVALTLLLAFEAQTDTLVLSKVRTEAEVGWYGAATTVAFGLLTLAQAYRFSAYPVMSRYSRLAPEKLTEFYRDSIRLIALLALPMTAGLVIVAPQLISLLYAPAFEPSILPLQVLSLALLLMFMNEPSSRMMLVKDRQRQALWLLVGATILNVILNLLLTPPFGATGAAFARLGSTLGLFGGYAYYVSTRIVYINYLKLCTASVMATFSMVLLLWPLRVAPLPLLVVLGSVIYVAVLALIDRTILVQARTAWQTIKSRTNSK